jgi:MFS superfamily sulfate permease-like transporter
VLVAAVLSIIGAALLDLAARGVKLVGVLPQGFPPFTIPDVSFSDMSLLIAGAVGIAVVALTDTISTASAFAARSGQEVRANQEMIGIGAANVAAGLFQGFPVSTSGSRTAVAEQSGSKTQLTGLVGAALIAVMLLFLPRLLQDLPQPTLAAVLIAAAISLADITGTARLWHQRRTEFEISLAAFLGVALLGVLPGIGVAVILSILNVFRRAWWPYQTKLGLVDGVRGYHDVTSYPHAQHLDGLALYRFDAPLIFANASTFRDELRKTLEHRPAPALDRDRRRTDHRCEHHRRRRARGTGRRIHRARNWTRTHRARSATDLRRAQGPRPQQAQAVRAGPAPRPRSLLHHQVGRRSVSRHNTGASGIPRATAREEQPSIHVA